MLREVWQIAAVIDVRVGEDDAVDGPGIKGKVAVDLEGLVPAALVEAAGGRVSDVDGSPLDFSQGLSLANRGIIVSNGAIHDRVVAAVMQVLQDEGD